MPIADDGQVRPRLTRVKVWFIDCDDTLYESSRGMFAAIHVRMEEFIARELGVSIEEGRRLQHAYWAKYGATFLGLEKHHAITPRAFFDATHRFDLSSEIPDDFSRTKLRSALKALKGKRVLVLLTDMTSFSDALKEIAITMEQIPSNRGYPGDLYSQLAARYEKAVDFEGAGSITILAVTTMPGDDVTHPVPDNTGYITEGQFYLRNGRIEPFGSLSRLKQQVNKDTREDHRTIMDAMIKLYAQYKDAAEKQSMGFRMSEWDKKLLRYGARFEEKMMDLSVNIPLEQALDLGWQILADCFEPMETGIPTKLSDKFWPKKG